MELKNLRYTNFHLHSHFSNLKMLDAYGSIDQIVDRCKKIGYTAVPLTDHGSVSGHIQLIRKCKKEGLKPIPGCEMYVVDDLEEMKKARDMVPSKKSDEQETDEYQSYKEDIKSKARRKMHFNVLPKNQKGLLSVWDLVTHSWQDGMYFKPSVDWKMLEKHKENLWLGTACESGPLGRVLQKEKYDGLLKIQDLTFEIEGKIEDLDEEKDSIEIEQLKKELLEKTKEFETEWKVKAENKLREKLQELKDLFGSSLYVEIIPISDERANWIYLLAYKIAKELNVLTIATNDSHYPEKKDSKFQDVLYCTNLRRSNGSILFNDEDRKRYTPGLFFIHSAEEMFYEMKNAFPTIPEEDIYKMIDDTQILVDGTELVVEPSVPAVAYREISDKEGERGTNLYRLLSELILKGWKFRGFDKASKELQDTYKARIIREVGVISNKGYIDYFLIMRDIMNWCDTDRPFIENFDKWFTLNGSHFYKGKSKEEIFEILTNETNLLKTKKPIATGIARGSAGGSLVTYLLQITNINPIPGGLLFERFLDYTRGDVYYKMNFDNYSKPQFLKDYPVEDKERLKKLELKYDKIIDDSFQKILSQNNWYHHLQLTREKWLLDHNQTFSREKEYFYTLLEKLDKKEISITNTNTENSILAWSTGVTSEEPKGDFIVNLTDIPDIDADFEDARRDEVYLYLIHSYGINNSCRISTYGEVKDKSGLDMLTRIFGDKDQRDPKLEKTEPSILNDIKEIKDKIEDYKKINDIKSTAAIKKKDVKFFLDVYKRDIDGKLIEPLEINYDENNKVIFGNEYGVKFIVEKYDWIWEFWESMFGQVIAMGQHAAGMIVHNKPLVQYGAMYSNKDKQTGEIIPVIAWDKNESESMGLMKLDILGLNTCANLREVNELVEKRKGFEHHWQRIPNIFEDKKTIELLHKGDVAGLFQLEGGTMLGLTKHIEPNNLEDVVMINAGGRPGPLEYIHSLQYKEKKQGTVEPFYFDNEIYEEITKDRYGLIIYQENIMAISKRMCLYDDKMVGKIRKMVGKATYGGLDDLEGDFIGRLVKNSGMKQELAKKLWDYIKGFGTYCFNKAHAEAYAMLAWIQGYYKANYPLEFYAGTLKTLPDKSEDKVNLLLKDYKDHGYKLLPPDINLSSINFEINKDVDTSEECVRVGLLYIKGLGIKQAEEILRKQPFDNYKDFIKKIDKRIVNAGVRQITKDIGLFNNIGGAPLIEEKLVPAIEFIEFLGDFKNIFEDLLSNYSFEKLIGLYSLFGVKEDKLPLDDGTNYLTLDNYKKIITKIKSKVNSFSNGIIKGVINKSEVEINNEYSIDLQELKTKIDEDNKTVISLLKEEINQIKKIEKELEKILFENSNGLEELENNLKITNKIKWKKENILKNIKEGIEKDDKKTIKTLINLFDLNLKLKDKESFSIIQKELVELIEKEIELNIKNSINKMKTEKDIYDKYSNLIIEKEKLRKQLSLKINLNYKEYLEENFQNLIEIENKVITDLGIDKGLHKIKIDNEKAIKHCPIMLNVDLSKYKALGNNFKTGAYYTLKQIEETKEEIKFGITVGMIRNIEILGEREKPTQGRVRIEIMIGEKISNLFINGFVYEKKEELFKSFKVADTILVTFKKSLRFPVIAVENIFDLDNFYNRVINFDLSNGPLTLDELKILK